MIFSDISPVFYQTCRMCIRLRVEVRGNYLEKIQL